MADINPKDYTKVQLIARMKELETVAATKIKEAEEKAVVAYQKGIDAAREFDAEMDTFLIKFLKRDDSSILVFVIALVLVLAGGIIGYATRGFL